MVVVDIESLDCRKFGSLCYKVAIYFCIRQIHLNIHHFFNSNRSDTDHCKTKLSWDTKVYNNIRLQIVEPQERMYIVVM